jgi:hypothetical protein
VAGILSSAERYQAGSIRRQSLCGQGYWFAPRLQGVRQEGLRVLVLAGDPLDDSRELVRNLSEDIHEDRVELRPLAVQDDGAGLLRGEGLLG